jgi:hypothetical protein
MNPAELAFQLVAALAADRLFQIHHYVGLVRLHDTCLLFQIDV